jgi:hypothetical protein
MSAGPHFQIKNGIMLAVAESAIADDIVCICDPNHRSAQAKGLTGILS